MGGASARRVRRGSDVRILAWSEKKCAGSADQDRSARGFSWCGRRVNGRSPVHAPPFSAAGRAVRLDRGELIDKATLSLPQFANALKTACQRPRLAQRLKRL